MINERIFNRNTGCIFLILLFSHSLAYSKDPNCGGAEHWPASMAFTQLKNEGLLDSNKLDQSKTTTKLIASEKKKKNLYHQVYLISFTEKTGRTLKVIAVSDASNEECSMGSVQIFVISKQI